MSSAPINAFSLYRRLKRSATAAFQIRRSSDSATKDIGFRGLFVDWASAQDFIGASNGHLATWYDQTGNGNHWPQAIAGVQPLVIMAGVVATVNGIPGTNYDGSDDVHGRSDAFGLSGSPALTIAATLKASGSSSKHFWRIGNVGTNKCFGLSFDSSTQVRINYSSTSPGFITSGPLFTTNPTAAVKAYVQTHASGAAVTTGDLRVNGAAVSVDSTAGSGSLSIVNTAAILSYSSPLSAAMFTNFWGMWNSVLAGTNLALVESEMFAHM